MSSTWSGMKWAWNERSFAHGQPARWLSAGHDRYKSWAIVESLLVFGGSNASALAFEHCECSERDRGKEKETRAKGEREKESTCVHMYAE